MLYTNGVTVGYQDLEALMSGNRDEHQALSVRCLNTWTRCLSGCCPLLHPTTNSNVQAWGSAYADSEMVSAGKTQICPRLAEESLSHRLESL